MSLQKFLEGLLNETECHVEQKDLQYGEKLGAGNFGEVHSCLWRKTPVAVKFLTNNLRNKQEFKSECSILQKLSHPNIVQFYGIVNDLKVGIVIELLEENLEKYNASNTKREQSYEFILDIARGLYYLHDRKPECIIHRDIKPSNLLLTRSKRVKICDFGISCFQQDPRELYKMTGETGTYRYMAPEVIKAEEYNSSVDIYSLGVIMYTLLEDNPYPYLSVTQIILAVTEKRYVPKFKHKTTKELIQQCWNYEPDERMTASDIIDEVERLMKVKKKGILW